MTYLPPRIKRDSGNCPHCDKPLVRRAGEDARDWKRRTHCNKACSQAARAMYVSLHEMLLNNSVRIPSTGCWEWQLYRDPKGYGRTMGYEGDVLAHRLSYREFKGPIADGLHILHSCDNPRCINPDHLRAGTNAENVEDRVKRHRSARMWGHNNPNWITGRHSRLPRYRVANDQ